MNSQSEWRLEGGQVASPKAIREKFGLGVSTVIEFAVLRGELVLKKKIPNRSKPRRAKLDSCVGVLKGKPENVDKFIEDIRGVDDFCDRYKRPAPLSSQP